MVRGVGGCVMVGGMDDHGIYGWWGYVRGGWCYGGVVGVMGGSVKLVMVGLGVCK